MGAFQQTMHTRSHRVGLCIRSAKRVVAFSSHSNSCQSASSTAVSRRNVVLLTGVSALVLGADAPALAAKASLLRKKVPLDQYEVSEVNGLKMYDVLPGKGVQISEGSILVVHWDVLYKGIDVVSSRLARTLGGNRTIAEPLEFTAGEDIIVTQKVGDSSSGSLFVGGGGPKPPKALSTSVIGMKEGGIRSVIVDIPELGYKKRVQELPAGAEFELRIEVLDIKKA